MRGSRSAKLWLLTSRLVWIILFWVLNLAAPLLAEQNPVPIASAPVTAAPAPTTAPVLEETKAEEANSDDPPAPPICPFKDHIQDLCAKETYTAEALFGIKKEIDLFKTPYNQIKKCKLWWWADYARNFHYPPLTEWAEDLQDAIIEKIDAQPLFDSLGFAPRPPRERLNGPELPASTCTVPTAHEEVAIIEHLRHLNFKSISSDTLNELVAHCFAFPVATAAWMSIGTRVTDSFVMPIGDINILILARTHVGITDLALGSLSEIDNPSGEIGYTAVDSCPIDVEPKVCVETYLEKMPGRSEYGFGQGFHHRLSALPFRTDLDGYFMNHTQKPREVELVIDSSGYLKFYGQVGENKNVKLTATVYDGQLAMVTGEPYCDPANPHYQRVALVPLALGEQLKALHRSLAAYSPSDFPETSGMRPGMIEKGCGEPISFSEWAAQTANALKHVGHHGVSMDVLFRTAAAERYRRRIIGEGIRGTTNDGIYGKWRQTYFETPFLPGSIFEKRAVRFILDIQGDGYRQGKLDAIRKLTVDETPATELRYFYKAVPLWPDRHETQRTHIIVTHLKDFDSLYKKSVIERFNTIATTCAPAEDHKRSFINAMYALFNAAPLQAGNGEVGKVFMAAAYENLFGKPMEDITDFSQVDVDAWLMTQEDFVKKYLPSL